MSKNIVLKVENLIGGRHDCAFLNVPDLTLSSGDILFIVGRNGSGKSTFLETIAGIIPPFKGALIKPDTITYMPSTTTIQDGVTGFDLYDLFAISRSKWKSQRICDVLEITSLLPRVLTDLSSGERQRVILSAVLQHAGDFVILDECLNHLDWKHAESLPGIITHAASKGRSFILTSHDLGWITRFPHASVICLEKGQILSEGKATDVLIDPKVQECFYFRSVFVDNPLDKSKILATATRD